MPIQSYCDHAVIDQLYDQPPFNSYKLILKMGVGGVYCDGVRHVVEFGGNDCGAHGKTNTIALSASMNGIKKCDCSDIGCAFPIDDSNTTVSLD